MKRKSFFTRLLIVLCTLFFLTLISLIVFIQYSFIVVAGTSMQPKFTPKDLIVVRQTHTTDVDYGDIVVAFSEDERKLLIKRVIGKSGDHIQIKTDGVYRNGEKLKEDYLNEQDYQYTDNIDVIVDDDTYYLLGDNRRVSIDSRSDKVGKIYTRNILGVYEFNITALTGKTAEEFPSWVLHIGLTIVGLFLILRFVLFVERKKNKQNTVEISNTDLVSAENAEKTERVESAESAEKTERVEVVIDLGTDVQIKDQEEGSVFND